MTRRSKATGEVNRAKVRRLFDGLQPEHGTEKAVRRIMRETGLSRSKVSSHLEITPKKFSPGR